jgi:cobalt-zinc-cadmium efflux system protein
LRKGTSLNERVAMLHLLEDVLGWIAVLIGSIIMMYFDAPFVDPLLSILISVFVLFNVYKNLRKSLLVILQGTPEDVNIEEISAQLKEIPSVTDVHDCHVWSLDGEYNILTVHLALDQDYCLKDQSLIKEEVKASLKDQPINHVTIEFEATDEECEQREH